MASTNEKKKRVAQQQLARKIFKVFTTVGFASVETKDIHFKLGGRDIEIDAAYLYENIVVLCEDTAGGDHDHILKKNEIAGKIASDVNSFLKWFRGLSPFVAAELSGFSNERIKIFFLYFSKHHQDWNEDDVRRYENLKLVPMHVLEYFNWITCCIKKSALYEVLHFLGLSKRDVGLRSEGFDSSVIDAPIISPAEFMGGDGRTRVVSFMFSPEKLLPMAYVMRKDGWEVSAEVYQRLIDKKKIKDIRKFLCDTHTTFYNNIIVSLPDGIRIIDKDGCSKKIFEVNEFTDGMKISIEREYNSIGIIDGQHRLYAYYVGGAHDDEIGELRKKLRLLVTGIIFPDDMALAERQKIQGKIFLDINENAKPVNASLMLHIKKMQEPFADTSIAQDVLEHMNQNGLFKGRFKTSALSMDGVPIASIVKYALKYLVGVSSASDRGSFLSYWSGNVDGLKEHTDEDAKNQYVEYCSMCLNKYFTGVSYAFKADWDWTGNRTLLPSVVTVNGFLIVLGELLKKEPPQEVEHYKDLFQKMKLDFRKEGFGYRSSQYRKLADCILRTISPVK